MFFVWISFFFRESLCKGPLSATGQRSFFAIFDVKTTVYAIAIVNFLFFSYTVFTQSDEHIAQFLGGKYNEEN